MLANNLRLATILFTAYVNFSSGKITCCASIKERSDLAGGKINDFQQATKLQSEKKPQ
jgi:hypothetical protein